jgi:carbon-monoxide dehydrogenase large subunit
VQGSGIGPYEGAQVRVDPSGQVFVTIGVAAQGQGHQTTLAQICAAELGVALEDVHIVAGDTQLFPIGMGTGGSRVAANAGPAVARTAREVRVRAQQVAAELLECAPDDVRIEEGRVFVAGVPGRALTLGRVAHAAIRSKALRKTGEPGLQRCSYFYPDTVTWASAPRRRRSRSSETRSRTPGVPSPHSGRAINPTIVEGQLRAAPHRASSARVLEELVYDDSGQLVTGSLMDYGMPKADQLPMLPVASRPSPVERARLCACRARSPERPRSPTRWRTRSPTRRDDPRGPRHARALFQLEQVKQHRR